MEVKCNRCSNIHTIPDSMIGNRKIYFFCTKCGHKVVVNASRSFAINQKSPDIREQKPLPFYSEILDAVSDAFNPAKLLMSLLYSLSLFTVLILFAMIFYKNAATFMTYQWLSVSIASIILAVLLFGHMSLLYFISKIQYRMDETGDTRIDWKFVLFDFKDDSIVILFYSVIIPLLFGLLILPITLFGEYGFTYAALMFPLLSAVAFIAAIAIASWSLIPSIIAAESLSPMESIANIFAFIRRELINIPFYLFFSQIVFGFIIVLVGVLFFAAISGAVYSSVLFSGGSAASEILAVVSALAAGLLSGFSITTAQSNAPPVSPGILIFFFFLFICMHIFIAFGISLHQSLIAKSCWIMNRNKRNSIPGQVILAMLVVFVFFLFLGARFLTVKQF